MDTNRVIEYNSSTSDEESKMNSTDFHDVMKTTRRSVQTVIPPGWDAKMFKYLKWNADVLNLVFYRKNNPCLLYTSRCV